jgi:HlyD family secretion protein
MHSRARIIAPVLLVVVLAGGGFWWWSQRASAANASEALSGSGTIEAEDVLITAEVAGRVQSLLVEEGQEVAAGQKLAQLDTALLEAQLEQARAAVAAAEANLAQLKAGTRPEDILAAQAAVAQARAARDGAAAALENAKSSPSAAQAQTAADGAYRTCQDAQANMKNPQELQVQIDAAQAQLDAAQKRLDALQAGARPEDREQARLAVVAAQNGYWAANLQQEDVQSSKFASDKAKEAAKLQVESARVALAQAQANYDKVMAGPTEQDLATAQAAVDGARRSLDTLLAIKRAPQSLRAQADAARAQFQNAQANVVSVKAANQAQVDAAEAQLAAAEAQLAQAQARQELAQNGARPEQIQAAEAQLAQARASQHQVEVQLAKATLAAPRAGLVLSRSIHEGEQANPGAALMTIGSLDTVRLTIYIGETDIGRVRQGQPVDVAIDSFPGRVFKGTVTFIAQEAQFTPRNVQTKDERATTVFAVRVELANPDHVLKPGMPADATIVE